MLKLLRSKEEIICAGLGFLTIRCMHPHKSNDITSLILGKYHGNHLKPYLCSFLSGKSEKRLTFSCDAWLALAQLVTSCI